METVVISVNHEDETGKYWSDSYIKNQTITVEDGETIHQAIEKALADECEMSYKGKPQGNIYRDDKDGNSRIVGYHYRTKHLIADRSADICKYDVPFTTWVTIHGALSPVQLEDIEVTA